MKFLFALLFLSFAARADITSCSAGFMFVPASAGHNAFCMSTAEYSANGQDFAVLGCSNGQSYLCSTMELQSACFAGLITTAKDHWMHTSDMGVGTYTRIQVKLWGGGPNCYNKQDSFVSNTVRAYRCCTR